MNLQDIYYVLSISAILIFIFTMLFIGVAIWRLYLTIHEFLTTTKQLVREVKSNTIDRASDFVSTPKSEIVSMVGIGVGSFLLSRLKNLFKK